MTALATRAVPALAGADGPTAPVGATPVVVTTPAAPRAEGFVVATPAPAVPYSSVAVDNRGLAPAAVSAQATVSIAMPTTVAVAPERPLLERLPLRVGVRAATGFTTSWQAPALDGLANEYGGHLGVAPLHWLSIEAHAHAAQLPHRVLDTNRDGRADAPAPLLTAFHTSLLARFRVFHDDEWRDGWSFGVGPGLLLPLESAAGRGVGPLAEALIARHMGRIGSMGGSWDLSLELRARTGFATLGDYQSVQLGVSAALEGAQVARRSLPRRPPGFVPGQTFGLELFGAGFPGPNALTGTTIRWGWAGGGAAVHAGLVLAGPFELLARLAYVGRGPGVNDGDWLHIAALEGAARVRWGWLFAEVSAGLSAPFATFRDTVRVTPHVGGGLGARVTLVDHPSDGLVLVLGARTRVGLFDEQAMTHVSLGVGLEWEGGARAPRFPTIAARAPRPDEYVVIPRVPEAGGALPAPIVTAAAVSPPVPVRTPPPRYVPARSVTIAVATERPVSTAPAAPVPLRVSLGFGLGVHTRGLHGVALDGMHHATTLGFGYAPRDWVLLGLDASLVYAPGPVRDANLDRFADAPGGGALNLALTGGVRFRAVNYAGARHAWAFGLGGGLFATGYGVGPLGEVLLSRHLGTIGVNSFELGVEARGRLGYVPREPVGVHGALFSSVTVGVSAAWEGGVRGLERVGVRRAGYSLGETLSFELGYALGLFGAVPGGQRLGLSTLVLGLRTGLVFSPGFEWSLRAGYMHRNGAEMRADPALMLFAETGPRVRVGWLGVEVFGGYAGTFGVFRDAVKGSPIAGAAVIGRFLLNGPDRHFGVSVGLQARFGVSEVRSYDTVGLVAGFEFEGGHQQAVAFAPLAASGAPRAPSGSGTLAPIEPLPPPPVPVLPAPPRIELPAPPQIELQLPARIEVQVPAPSPPPR